MKYIVSPAKAHAEWEQGETAFVDCRFVLGQPKAGREAYAAEHIPGAFYLDLEEDLSAPVREDRAGGRHPLPDADVFAAKLTRLGIADGRRVIAYDDQGGAMAARLWWLLAYLGHDNACVLDGGFAAWKREGYPTAGGSEKEPPKRSGAFIPRPRTDWVIDAAGIEARRAAIAEGRVVLLDSREEVRYRGLSEPIDPVAGHIPGARHAFWKANLDAEGRFRSVRELMKRFEPLQGAEEIIVYCGSGVTACPNVLALREAGFTNVKLYAGSWSDWVSNPSRPVERDGG